MTAPESRQLTREELHALVWSKPVSEAAKDWGFSGVGFSKLCRRHDVPLPYRGFWARKAAGQNPRPLPLPALRKGVEKTVSVNPKPVPLPKPVDPLIEQAIARERSFAGADSVPEDLRGADKLVASARAALEAADPDEYGRLAPSWNAACPINIHVSSQLLRRALRIAEGIIRAANRRGYVVRVPEKGKTAEIFVGDNGFEFRIEESSKRFENQPDPKHPDRYYPRFRYEPRGTLAIKLGFRDQWQDSEKKTAEERLGEFFEALAVMAIERERSIAESKAWQKRWDAQQRLRAEYDAASKQAAELMKRMDDADGLRRLLARFESEGVDMSAPVGEHESWRLWLIELIRVTDPLADARSGEIKLGRQCSTR